MSSYSAVIPLAFLSALALSLVLTPLCERLARRWGVLDLPSSRKVHTQPTPRLGGIAVFLAFAVTALLFLRPVIRDQMTLLLAGAVAFFLIGLVDDLRNAGPWKLAVAGGGGPGLPAIQLPPGPNLSGRRRESDGWVPLGRAERDAGRSWSLAGKIRRAGADPRTSGL